MILGIDEVGRGPWAGPLVVGAVVLGCEIEGLTDSKKLSATRRTKLAGEIHKKAAAVGLGWVHADEIDMLGLASALQLACRRAVAEVDTLGVAYHEIIIDGTINLLKDTPKGDFVMTLKKADLLIPTVSAASIVAKVARDEYMARQGKEYPEYGFRGHVGYGTAKHRAAIEEHGVTPLHRLSFAPLAKYRESSSPLPSSPVLLEPPRRSLVAGPVGESAPSSEKSEISSEAGADSPRKTVFRGGPVAPLAATRLSTKQIGDRAEEVVAEYLQTNGHEIVERNWKTKFCEIDIVSKKDGCVYFTEVKYRKNDKAGGGMAAITPKKLRQMKFAAEYYALKNKLANVSLRLAAAEVAGSEGEIRRWFEITS